MVQKIITFNVSLKSTEKQWVQKIPEVYTNDLGSVSIQFNITDCTDTELTGSSAIVLLKMRDGSFFQGPSADVSRTLNVFSYTLKENEGNHDGLAEIQLIVSISGKEFATQKYQFKVNSGLDSEVAREIMIYDWTTLTAEARAYIDQFTADEMVRDAEFDNNEFDRNTAFVASQDARTLAFGTEQTDRGTAFTAEQNERTTIFNESESGIATAETVRVTAEEGRVEAETDRVTEESKRVTSESGRVTEESKRVTAESGRVTAESGRVIAETNRAAAFTAFDTRLTAEETATANNKISTVKGKTFADVDARFEELETINSVIYDSTLNAAFINGTWTADTGANTLNCSVSHGLVVGDPVSFVADTGTLPENIIAEPEFYYVSAVPSATTIQVSLTRNGVAVTIASTGVTGWGIRKANVVMPDIGLNFVKYKEVDIYSNLEFVPRAVDGNSYVRVGFGTVGLKLLLNDINVTGQSDGALLYSLTLTKKYVKIPLRINIIKIGSAMYKILIDIRGLQSSNSDMSSSTVVNRDFGGIITGAEVTKITFTEAYTGRVKNGTRIVIIGR